MRAVLNWLGRHGLRVAAVAVFALLALGLVPECCRPGSVVLPRLSPILSLLGALGARQWAGWAVLLGVPVLVLSFFRGRVFCWRFCPMGFLAELASKLNPWGRRNIQRVPALNKALALVIAATAACGYPLLIWLDPLCIFNGFFAVWRLPLAWTAGVTGIGFVAILLASICVPNIWCHKLCPLGGLQQAIMEFANRLKARKTAKPDEPAPKVMSGAMARRTLLAAVPVAAASLVAKKAVGANAAGGIRPPGADLLRFNSLCARCGNCMTACPFHLIHPDFGETGIDGLFSPVIHLRGASGCPDDMSDYCSQECAKCTQVCPTGALKPLSLLQKHAVAIGLAEIDRTKCIAWKSAKLPKGDAERSDCAVCDEYCPYKAVALESHNGVNCPVVRVDKCRGCGACEAGCPGEGLAIRVRPLKPEEYNKKLLPTELDSPEKAAQGEYGAGDVDKPAAPAEGKKGANE